MNDNDFLKAINTLSTLNVRIVLAEEFAEIQLPNNTDYVLQKKVEVQQR